MLFDLCTINWQSISAIVTTLTLLGAYLYPGFRDRWKVTIGGVLNTINDKESKIELFIRNKGNRRVEIISWEIRYKNTPEKLIELNFMENCEDGIMLYIERNRTKRIEYEVNTDKVSNIIGIVFNDSSGKKFFMKKEYLRKY